jgi:hypothetical protein
VGCLAGDGGSNPELSKQLMKMCATVSLWEDSNIKASANRDRHRAIAGRVHVVVSDVTCDRTHHL